LKEFYAWAVTGGLIDASRSPIRGIWLPPRRTMPATLVGPKDGRLYEALLANSRLDRRTRVMLLLLVHGLTQRDVVTLRSQDLDLSAGGLVLRHGRSSWFVPLTDKTVCILRDYTIEHAVTVGSVGWLFPSRNDRRQARPDAVRNVVRRAAYATFPLPSQAAKRRRICAAGFRELYLRRLLCTRIMPKCLATLTRFKRMDSIRKFVDRNASPAHARHELVRVAARWPSWIGAGERQ
jgi:hypothetical protein